MKKHYKPDPNEASVLLPGDLMQFEFFQFKHNLIEKVIDPVKYYVWLDVVQGPPASRIDDFGKRTGIFEYKEDDLLRLLHAGAEGKAGLARSRRGSFAKQRAACLSLCHGPCGPPEADEYETQCSRQPE